MVRNFPSGYDTAPIIGFGGPTDIAFIGKTADVIVTLVGPQFGGSDIVGIYRVDGATSCTVVADIGAFSLENPPDTPPHLAGAVNTQFRAESSR